jgi:uncharacterized protein (TIGR02118 family)
VLSKSALGREANDEVYVTNTVRGCSSPLVSRRHILRACGAIVCGAVTLRILADAAGEVVVGTRAYTAIFPGGDRVHFDYVYYRDRHLAMMQSLYGDALTRVEMRKPLSAQGEPPPPYAAIVNFWISDAEAFAKASAAHGQDLVRDKVHFTNAEQEVQREVVFGQTGKPASAIRIGERCLTVLYPYGRSDRFDHEYYRDHHMTSLIDMFGREAIDRIEMRKGQSSPDGRDPPLYSCTANVYVADAQAFAAAASRNRERVAEDVRRFTSVTPASFMTEVVGAFGA